MADIKENKRRHVIKIGEIPGGDLQGARVRRVTPRPEAKPKEPESLGSLRETAPAFKEGPKPAERYEKPEGPLREIEKDISGKDEGRVARRDPEGGAAPETEGVAGTYGRQAEAHKEITAYAGRMRKVDFTQIRAFMNETFPVRPNDWPPAPREQYLPKGTAEFITDDDDELYKDALWIQYANRAIEGIRSRFCGILQIPDLLVTNIYRRCGEIGWENREEIDEYLAREEEAYRDARLPEEERERKKTEERAEALFKISMDLRAAEREETAKSREEDVPQDRKEPEDDFAEEDDGDPSFFDEYDDEEEYDDEDEYEDDSAASGKPPFIDGPSDEDDWYLFDAPESANPKSIRELASEKYDRDERAKAKKEIKELWEYDRPIGSEWKPRAMDEIEEALRAKPTPITIEDRLLLDTLWQAAGQAMMLLVRGGEQTKAKALKWMNDVYSHDERTAAVLAPVFLTFAPILTRDWLSCGEELAEELSRAARITSKLRPAASGGSAGAERTEF